MENADALMSGAVRKNVSTVPYSNGTVKGPHGIQNVGIHQSMENQKKFEINIFRKRVVQPTRCETHCSWARCRQTTCIIRLTTLQSFITIMILMLCNIMYCTKVKRERKVQHTLPNKHFWCQYHIGTCSYLS